MSARPAKEPRVFRLGELFSGPGGLALGALSARVTDNAGVPYKMAHAWASDYHSDSVRTYAHNLAKDAPESVILSDVHALPIESLPPIDAFAYGFPCNDFSVVGEHKGTGGDFGGLYRFGVRVLDRFQPRFFVAENVKGLLSANDGRALSRILSHLGSAGGGYELTVHLYKSEDYGVPQVRHRLIIVGMHKTLGVRFEVPAPTHRRRPVTARTALESPPIPTGAFNTERTRQAPAVVERLKYIKPGENAWTAVLPERLRLNVKKARLSQIYKRLDPDKPAYTITGSGGGGTHCYHYDEPRALTNRERARLQSFPDDFEFLGSKESVRRQVGMAVPPLLAQVIFTAALKTIAGVAYESVPCSWAAPSKPAGAPEKSRKQRHG